MTYPPPPTKEGNSTNPKQHANMSVAIFYDMQTALPYHCFKNSRESCRTIKTVISMVLTASNNQCPG